MTIIRVLIFLAGLLLLSTANAVNFTYDGINRRDPLTETENLTIQATGEVFCIAANSGEQRGASGFFIDAGQPNEFTLLLSSGHSFRDNTDNQYHHDCLFRPVAEEALLPLDNIRAGNLLQADPADFIRNDWGLSVMTGLRVPHAIPMTQRSFEQLMNILESGEGEIKLYAGNRSPAQGAPRIQISDQCSVWKPVPGAILGAGHSLYTNCDATESSSGGALVLEFSDGRVEAIGIMFGAIHTTATVNRLLAQHEGASSIADIETAIDMIPSPTTIINVAVPLLSDMQPDGLRVLLDSYTGQ
ncbi:MAG: hypothetical protein CMP91_02895 [Gammaproteobacteria bacterium]|nr:hypothetical protein [Gammaproteobacteria bacterium]MAY02389.1 hypothetical protein [Gammaproteobacteria bacterium]|tara:strand:+ start:2304 stop:3206 length:903 start_codon:yes stop_codon:yes gene_type:complete